MTTRRVYFETFGCQMNVADTERAASNLRKSGYEIIETAISADIVILNTCSVRERAEHKVFTRIGEIRHRFNQSAPLIGVMGCVAQLEGEKIFDKAPTVNFVVGTGATGRLANVIERALIGHERVFDLHERQADEEWNTPALDRRSKFVGLVPIIEGCNKFCTYCIVPFSRGRERSRPLHQIVEEVLELKGQGFQEVQLIGQNVNSYRPSAVANLLQWVGATPFSKLLRAVASTDIPRIKFTTSFPRDFHLDIVKAIEEYENLCNWVHLPVQSGSDKILKLMRRGYKVADYLSRVETIKSSSREISLTSDIIIGFPGETEEDFEATCELVRQCQFDSLFIFKYSSREGTPSAKFSGQVPEAVKTNRFTRLNELQLEIQAGNNKKYLGRTLKVLVEKLSVRSEADLMGHSECHKVVNFKGQPGLIGQVVEVKIVEVKSHSLYGIKID